MSRFRTVRSVVLMSLIHSAASNTRADIFQWEYINPANPGLGKQQSTLLCPDGAGAVVGIATDLEYRNLTKAYLVGANLSDEWGPCGEEGCVHYFTYLAGANLSPADLTGANLTSAVLIGANLSDAEIRGANFHRDPYPSPGVGGLTMAQLYSTASYKAHDLSGIRLGNNELGGVNLTGQNLSNAYFFAANFNNANLSAADARGANFTSANLSGADTRGANFYLATLNGAETTHLIQTNGHIANIFLWGLGSLVVRDYDGNPAASPPAGPLPIVVDQHFLMDGTGKLRLEFDADPWDSTISFATGIPVTRGGTLELTFAPDVNLSSQLGRTIDLFDWTGVMPTGTFNVTSPYSWNLSNLYTTGEVTLTGAPGIVPGDFNGDGKVDAADYVVWRKGLGVASTQENYNLWHTHFGRAPSEGWSAGSGTALPSTEPLSAVVPKPTTLVLLTLSIPQFARRRSRRLLKQKCVNRAAVPGSVLSIAASLTASFVLGTPLQTAGADIFQWEYINPADPSQGKQQSTTLAPGGAGVNAEPGVNLSNRDLTKAYLIGANLSPSVFCVEEACSVSYADLTGTTLSQADLTNALFYGAILTGANLAGAEVRGANFTRYYSGDPGGITANQLYSTGSYQARDLSGIKLSGYNLAGVNLVGQNLTNAHVRGATLTAANLSQANFTNAYLDFAKLENADLSQANLTEANFGESILTGANLTDAEVRGANFGRGVYGTGLTLPQLYSTLSYQSHDLTGIRLYGNNLYGANLVGQNLANADLIDAKLAGADLRQANLSGAFFSADGYFGSAVLIGANLGGANLTNAHFAGSVACDESSCGTFPGANLTSANLNGADARRANFYLATMTGANTTNLIQSDGHIAGLDLTGGASLTVRDYELFLGPDVPIVVDQYLATDATGVLRLEFDADPWGSTISFAPGIPVTRGGTLELTFAPDVNLSSQLGRTIDPFDWTGVNPTGAFNVSSPYTWNLSKLYTTGEVTLTGAPGIVPGDFNGNGKVDTADYVVWRKGISVAPTQANYDIWRTHFGAGSGAAVSAHFGANGTVPEPASATTILVVLAASLATSRRRGVAKNRC